VADSANGLRFQKAPRTTGWTRVDGVGGVGIWFEQADGDDNLNQADVNLEAVNCGSDGIRSTNSSGNAPNINGLTVRVRTVFNNGGYGVNWAGGFAGRLVVNNQEGNASGGTRTGGGVTRMQIHIVHSESNTTGVILDSDANYVYGDIQDGVSDNVTDSNNVIADRVNKTAVRVKQGSTGVTDNEVLIDKTNGRLVWQDDEGTRYYVAGTTF